jgi:tetratricopeptide (TPR) repeat protein
VAQVKIDIATEFTGKKGFKEAETSTDKLSKSVKKLAGGLLLAFGTQKIIAFGKASVKAFVEDDKAATALGQTLKNLNLAYGSQIGTVNGFISRLEMQTGVLDDELRPAMDRLLRATGDVTKSQELLTLALDISAGTGKSVTQVSQSLQKAYLGQKQALGRLGVGLTKAELETSSFEEVQERLSVLFAGQASAAADTYAGSLAKLTIAGNNAKETIGKGLVDALKTASGSTSTDQLVEKINNASEAMANFIREGGKFIEITKQIFDLDNLSWKFRDPNAFMGMGNVSMTVSSQDTQKADLAARKKAEAELLKIARAQAAAAAKIAKDKRIGLLIDKAKIALNKGEEIFDMDKIQIAAALTNQAEQLGKATTSSQLLQIANDTARLNVKQSILALEDAIASKDEAAIIAATNKLNADLKVLGTLSMQNVKLADIKSILDSLKPVDLINQSNLDKALASIQEMLRLLAQANTQAKASLPTSATLGSGISAGDYIAPISTAGGSIGAILEYAEAASARANAFADLLDMENASAASQMASTIDLESIARSSLLQGLSGGAGVAGAVSGSRYAAQAANAYNITIQAGIGDPEAIARAVEDVVRQSYQRGTSATGLLAV